jgi:DNA-binding LacI/PurR family transcriptional regulator
MPSMTAMNNTGSMVSRVAAELLLNQLRGGAVETRQILIKSELIPGKTTGLAPTMRKRARKRNAVQQDC